MTVLPLGMSLGGSLLHPIPHGVQDSWFLNFLPGQSQPCFLMSLHGLGDEVGGLIPCVWEVALTHATHEPPKCPFDTSC